MGRGRERKGGEGKGRKRERGGVVRERRKGNEWKRPLAIFQPSSCSGGETEGEGGDMAHFLH